MFPQDDCILFEDFVKLLQSISQIKPLRGNARHNMVKNTSSLQLINQWINRVRQYYGMIPPDVCKFFFRLFFPEEDVRRRYNLKEATLARTLAVDIFGLSVASRGAGRALMQWSDYRDDGREAKLGCLGAEVEKTLKERYSVRQGTSPSLERIDVLLDELASLSGYSDLGYPQIRPRRARAAILKDLYLSLNPLEAKFLTQIILKDLRPVLYPLAETHTTRALLHYKSNAIHLVTKWEVMKAWHTSMPNIYRSRAILDEAARVVESLPSTEQLLPEHDMLLPALGIPVEVPKSQKGVKLSHTLNFFQGETEVWSETKYDGERMQIHVDLSRPPSERITIFSKSKRNSTQDRMGTHPIIRASLGLAPYLDDHLQYPELRNHITRLKKTVTKSVILDAEMVAYSAKIGDIDEFWRIRSLVESTARGVRSRCNDLTKANEPESQESKESDHEKSPEIIVESLQSNASDNDGCSLLDLAYNERRRKLERTINIIPGYASLSRRQCITLTRGMPAAIRELAHIFSQHIANHQEGLVLKASASTYNSYIRPWVKLKRDYIPGYGDTIDLIVIGAAWNKERARELRVAPETFTTFFVAALDKSASGLETAHLSPQFQVLFTVEYGIDRDQLETFNLYIRTSETRPFKDEMSCLPYRFRLSRSPTKPTIMFSQPLLGELFGAGFSKSAGENFYSLRFPRLNKVWRSNERNWNEGKFFLRLVSQTPRPTVDPRTSGTCLEEFQKIARSSIGCESSDEWVSRSVDAMWGCDTKLGPKDPRTIAETTRQWYRKLLRLEGIAMDNVWALSDQRDLSGSPAASHRATTGDIQEPSTKRRKLHTNRDVARPLWPLGSVTNFPEKDTTSQRKRRVDTVALSPQEMPTVSSTEQHILQKKYTDIGTNNGVTTVNDTIKGPLSPNRTDISQTVVARRTFASNMQFNLPVNVVQLPTPVTSNVLGQTNCLAQSSLSLSPKSPDFMVTTTSLIKGCSLKMRSGNASGQISCWPPHFIHTPVVQFIQDAYVWIHRDSNNKRPANRPPALHLVPQNRRIGVMYYLLIICGCHVESEGEVYYKRPELFAHVNKCVMFVDTGDDPDDLEAKQNLNWLFNALESWRTELNAPGNKELFVFSSNMITHSSLATFRGDVALQALWRSRRR